LTVWNKKQKNAHFAENGKSNAFVHRFYYTSPRGKRQVQISAAADFCEKRRFLKNSKSGIDKPPISYIMKSVKAKASSDLSVPGRFLSFFTEKRSSGGAENAVFLRRVL
jgi:hypothetical protein